MSTENTVLLARPHPFIVDRMTRFLQRNGFAARAVSEFDGLSGRDIKGVVISTDVSKDGGGIGETFARIRQSLPDTPIMFATLMPPAIALPALEGELGGLVDDPVFITVDAGIVGDAHLGRTNGFVVFNKDQIAAADSAGEADHLVARHFH